MSGTSVRDDGALSAVLFLEAARPSTPCLSLLLLIVALEVYTCDVLQLSPPRKQNGDTPVLRVRHEEEEA